MVLPSIRTSGSSDSIIISPFTNFLSPAIEETIRSEGLDQNLTVADGCTALGDSIQEKVDDKVDEIIAELDSLFGINYYDLVSDFIAGQTNDVLTEEKAIIIARWLPFLTSLKLDISDEMTATFNERVVPYFSMDEDSRNRILSDETLEDIALDFSSYYVGPTNSSGWYYDQNIFSYGAKLNVSGQVIPWKCADGSESCLFTSYGLDSIYNSSIWYMNRRSFRNDNAISGHENKLLQVYVEDESRWISNTGFPGDPLYDENSLRRDCLTKEEITFFEPFNDDITFRFTFNYGFNNIDINVLDCRTLAGIEDPLDLTFLEYYAQNSSNQTEELMIQMNSPTNELVHLDNEIINIWENRENFDVVPLLNEIDDYPRAFKDISALRAKVQQDDYIYVYLTIRDSDGIPEYTYNLRVQANENDDSFWETTGLGNDWVDSGLRGQEARNSFHEKLKQTEKLNLDSIAGSSPP